MTGGREGGSNSQWRRRFHINLIKCFDLFWIKFVLDGLPLSKVSLLVFACFNLPAVGDGYQVLPWKATIVEMKKWLIGQGYGRYDCILHLTYVCRERRLVHVYQA